jgi:CubicO group peptidase (beta-lactamase class C family)
MHPIRTSLAVGALIAAPLCAQVSGPLGARADSVLLAAQSRGFSGVARVVVNGATVLEKGYGLANRALGVSFSPNTIVQIGSNTKDFTALAILQLNDRKLLSTTDTLGKFFPNAPADKRGITVRQVLDHRAGFPDFVFPVGLKGADFEPVGRAEFLQRILQQPLIHASGTTFSYSNSGYSLLAALIEQITSSSYDRYVQDNILMPLGMQHTGFALPAFDQRQLAHGYRDGEDIGTILGHPHPSDGPYWNLRGNGGMSSTLDDMHTFYEALFTTTRLVSDPSRALHFHPDEPVALAGSDGVSYFIFERFPMLKSEIMVASNDSRSPAPAVRRALAGALGLPGGGDGPGAAPNRAATTGRAISAPVAALVADFVRSLNAGDSSALRAFVGNHFVSDPAAPSIDARVQRLLVAHRQLGIITIDRLRETAPGAIEASGSSPAESSITLMLQVDGTPPPRFKSVGIQVGGH